MNATRTTTNWDCTSCGTLRRLLVTFVGETQLINFSDKQPNS